MATNPNETYPYTIVHATRWSKGGRAERKTRLVVLRFNLPAGSTKYRYAVRWQTDRGEDGPTFGGAAYPSAFGTRTHGMKCRMTLASLQKSAAGKGRHQPRSFM